MIGPLGRGQLDVGAGTVSAGLYNAVERDIALRAVADKGSMRPGYGFSGLMVRKDMVDSGRFKTFKDLKGMKIAVGTFASANSSAVNEALKRGGLKWADANMVELQFPQHLPAYANKAIDASIKELKLLQDPNMTVERIVDTSIAEQAAKELGPYRPRRN